MLYHPKILGYMLEKLFLLLSLPLDHREKFITALGNFTKHQYHLNIYKWNNTLSTLHRVIHAITGANVILSYPTKILQNTIHCLHLTT